MRGWIVELKIFLSSTTFVFNLNTYLNRYDFVKCKALTPLLVWSLDFQLLLFNCPLKLNQL